MELRTFIGGIHPPHSKKSTEKKAVAVAVEPKVVMIPIQQHIGAPCQPIVEVGELVKRGQKIADTEAFVSAPIHSSVSGEVKEIKEMLTPTGKSVCIVIESDGANELHESVQPKGDLEKLTKEEILKIIREAGITGMGGASFPTHVKLSPPPDKPIDTVILNGAECEPFLTADHRLMLESPEKVILGLKAMMKSLNVTKGIIGIENNKKDAIQIMQDEAAKEEGIDIVVLEAKYPQGAEKQLIYACTNRVVPSGALPMEVKVVVSNVGTAAAISDAISTGMPLVERIATITGGGVVEPKNLLIKVGTPFNEIIEQCGGYNGEIGKLIMGGPMMGLAQYTDEIPAIKGTSGILVLTKKEARLPKASNCIRCGKCVSICPMGLLPLNINSVAERMMWEAADEYKSMDCIECGSCSFICPSKRPLLQSIRLAKAEVGAMRRKQQEK